MTALSWVWLALGGALGTLGRYVVSGHVDERFGASPLGIFVVNISGAFAIGFFLTLAEGRFLISPDVRRFVATGILGGYTTFSTLSFESFKLLEAGDYTRGLANAFGSLAAGLVAVWLGMALARIV
jgi:CrcB protein